MNREPVSDDWRERLGRRLVTAVVVLLGIVVFTLNVFLSHRRGLVGTIRAIESFAFVTGVIGLYDLVTRRLTSRQRGWVIAIGLLTASAPAYFTIGFNPGGALAIAFAVCVAALLLDARAVVIVVALGVAIYATAAFGLGTGRWEPVDRVVFGPNEPATWARTGILSLLFWSLLGAAMTYVLEAIAAAKRRIGLERMQRERAEAERVEAEVQALRAQQLDALAHMAAALAHDLNNALLVVQLSNEVACDEQAAPAIRNEARDAIATATEQASELAKQILRLGRQPAGAPAPARFDDLVAAAVTMLRSTLPEDIELTVDVATRATVIVTPDLLVQAVLNLVLNAREAMPEGGCITMHARREADRVVLSVEDTGPGMDEATRRRAFDPFFTTKGVGERLGLGLSVVRSMVERSGGQVTLASSTASGARVVITLPAVGAAT